MRPIASKHVPSAIYSNFVTLRCGESSFRSLRELVTSYIIFDYDTDGQKTPWS